MNLIIALAGVCALVAGLVQIFNRDMAWEMAERGYEKRGIEAERDMTWEFTSILLGIVVVVAGVCLIGVALTKTPEELMTPKSGGSHLMTRFNRLHKPHH